MENYKEYCRDYIIDRIDDWKDTGCDSTFDLADFITQHDNVSGSFTYSTYKAKQYIKEWFDDLDDFLEEYERDFGESLKVNPFNDSEKFHGIIVIRGVEKMLSNLQCLPNEEFTLTEELIASIKKELSELNINE